MADLSNHSRIAHPAAFLALTAEDVLSRRSHSFPVLTRVLSTGTPPSASQKRRRSNIRDDDANSDLESCAGSIGDARSIGGAGAPRLRSMRLIGQNNPRYNWEQYYKSEEELRQMKKPVRDYYKRTNYLVEQYTYIDRLLDSSLPHSLIEEYNQPSIAIPKTIQEEVSSPETDQDPTFASPNGQPTANGVETKIKVKRTPRNLYKIPTEGTPLLTSPDGSVEGSRTDGDDEESNGEESVVKVAIYVNFAANTFLLAAKTAVIALTNSLSVLASLVDAALDFLSTAIVWTTSKLVARQDQYTYPVGRRRLEPIGVLVFSVIMITSFSQVLLESFNRLNSGDHSIVQLTLPATIIMAGTVVVKFACWLWCRLIKNSSVQALAQDAMTDVVFNTFSIIFPLVGFYAKIWWLDALGGALLSLYVIINWSRTSLAHIRNLSGAAASADERNILLYLTMRFAKAIKQIQGLQAYHAGDRLNVEVDVVLDESTPLRDSHDLGESLQYMLESVPFVDRAFVHLDYASWNLPSHMAQDD